MTIERPMFPPRAESVDSFIPQPAPDPRHDEAAAGDPPEPTERPSAAVVRFPRRRVARLRAQQPDDGATFDDRERASKILKAATTFTACCAAYDGAWKAERTGNGLFAGGDGIVGERFCNGAENALARLTRLVRKADENTIMTVELRSVAAVAGFILDREREQGCSSDVSLDRGQVEFLMAFAALVDRVGYGQYHREYTES